MPDDHPLGSCTPTHLAAARHAPEGPRAASSCDGCAAPLAPPGWGEHGHDVLSTPSARLEAGSSDRAVVTRERRWLVAGWNDPYGRGETTPWLAPFCFVPKELHMMERNATHVTPLYKRASSTSITHSLVRSSSRRALAAHKACTAAAHAAHCMPQSPLLRCPRCPTARRHNLAERAGLSRACPHPTSTLP